MKLTIEEALKLLYSGKRLIQSHGNLVSSGKHIYADNTFKLVKELSSILTLLNIPHTVSMRFIYINQSWFETTEH